MNSRALWNAEWQLKWKNVPGNDSRNLDTDLLSLHMCATTVWVRVFFWVFFLKSKPLLSLHDSSHGKKDTASKLQSESQWPRFSVRGQKPLRMVDMESHDAQSAGKKEEAEFTLDLKPAIRSSPTQSS